MDPTSHHLTSEHEQAVLLRFDTGQAYTINAPTVLGRSPLTAASRGSHQFETLRSVCPSGDVGSVSRTHAVISLTDEFATLRDAGSLNGTFIWDRYARCWQRVLPGQPVILGVGATIAIGLRTARIEYSTAAT